MNVKLFDAIVFDLGGVLVELSGVSQMLAWMQTPITVTELWSRWLASPAVRAFETGQGTAEAFAAQICCEFALSVPPTTFLEAFTYWPRQLFPGVRELLRALSPCYTLVSLSNTNALHWQRLQCEMDFLHLFALNLPSHETQLIKPDREVFIHAIKTIGAPAERIVFVDDNQQNVDQACAVGMEAHRTVGIAEVKTKLDELGLLVR
jgi:putative hydrolase of the HAD superfamily